MTPQALEKLLRKHEGHWPGLRGSQPETLLTLARGVADMETPGTRANFWGLVDTVHTHKDGSAVIHCFNHSTTPATFPWNAEAVGMGQRFPLRLTASGTILARKTHATPWHSLDTAFLVFRVAGGSHSARALERIEPGLLICDPSTAVQSMTLRVCAPAGWNWPRSGSPTRTTQTETDNPAEVPIVLSHWLSQPIPGHLTLEPPQDILTSTGLHTGCRMGTLRLDRPVVADPGWIVAFHLPTHPSILCYGVVTEVGRESPDSPAN